MGKLKRIAITKCTENIENTKIDLAINTLNQASLFRLCYNRESKLGSMFIYKTMRKNY